MASFSSIKWPTFRLTKTDEARYSAKREMEWVGYKTHLTETSEPDEIPMAPITMLRNALGIDEGGSGVAIDRAAHARSVEFWRTHANWR